MPLMETARPRLLVADQVAGNIRLLSLPDGSETGRLEGRHLAEHAGFLALPRGRVAFVDDLAGELVVLDPYGPDSGRPLVAAAVPVATPAEHLAADPSGRLLAVTTGLGRNENVWSDLLTAVDLGGADGPRSVRVRTRTGEPGVTILPPEPGVTIPGLGITPPGPDLGVTTATPDPAEAGSGTSGTSDASAAPGASDALVVLRHREPGSLTAYRHAGLLASAPGCPPVTPAHELPLPDHDGHGDAVDPLTGELFAAAGSGVHRARRAGATLVAGEPLPWAGPGRGWYLRLDPVRRMLWSCVRGGPAEPGRWPKWTNDAWWHRIDAGDTGRLPLGPGLVFRLAVCARHIAYARIHPDGDELILVTAAPGERPRIGARLPLPAMAGAPRAGGTPWDGVQRRAVAGSPGGDLVAVTRGGHGEIHLIDASRAALIRTLRLPTALDDGGHLALVSPGDGAELDPVGR
ncbi:hypothetical protein [Streptomyces jumonjinensis]|uniref:Uncharacterized protein n=1 Tax=Streptomyces jumonjinensis TaxID=1945 RepID=A0A646KBG3_STRJU|nr:hypothetical protein [Streptomyces jumonjinensis]MQS99430.1 hypothetical protein [Streptomyces jumonjinensis]